MLNISLEILYFGITTDLKCLKKKNIRIVMWQIFKNVLFENNIFYKKKSHHNNLNTFQNHI